MPTLVAPAAGVARGLTFEQMALALLFIALVAMGALLAPENDTFWHLRVGQDIWNARAIPRVDTYSFTANGSPYTDHEWLSQPIFYLAYHYGGVPLIETLAAVVIAAVLMMTYRLMTNRLLTRFVVMAAVLSIASAGWALRPQLFTLLALALLLTLLARERYVWVPPLFVLWSNLHGGVLLGNVVVGAALGAAGLRAISRRDGLERRRACVLALVFGASVLATAATPLGFRVYPFAIETARRSRALHIIEWFVPVPPDPLAIGFWAVAIVFLSVVVLRRRSLWQGSWSDWVLAAAALALLPVAASSYRNVGPFLVAAAPALGRVLGADARLRWPRRLRRAATATSATPASVEHPRLNLIIVVAAGAAALVLVASLWARAPRALGWRPVSEGALAAIRQCPGPLYNHYNEGGYLMWFVPERPVYADSRQDLYPFDFLTQHFEIEHRMRPYRPTFERWGIGCAFLSTRSPTADALLADGWRSRFRDDKWVVLAAP